MATVSENRSGFTSLKSGSSGTTEMRGFASVPLSLRHELDANGTGEPITEILMIPASRRPTLVEVTSSVCGESARRLSSPQYLASVRRRTCAKIALAVSRLEKYSDSENFNARASGVVESIRELIAKLLDAKEEGNSREILRQVRDTFLNGGWEDYRRPGPREAAATVMNRLANAEEETTPDDVDAAEAELENRGIRASLPRGLFAEVLSEEESEPT